MKLEEIRPCLARFAIAMEQKLRENDHKSGWEDMCHGELMDCLQTEVRELEDAFQESGNILILEEAVDVANFAMMIFDNSSREVRSDPDNKRTV